MYSMKVELFVLVITAFFVANVYHDGKYITMMKSWKKYYQMIAIAFAGLSAYLFIRKHPSDTRTLLTSASGMIKHLPIDREAGRMFSPLLDLTAGSKGVAQQAMQEQRIRQSGGQVGGKSTKRCVSETKKKYVASQQGWRCGKCNCQLPAWFEVDHKMRLEHGGSNHIDNLVALCRDCHGEKTAMENL